MSRLQLFAKLPSFFFSLVVCFIITDDVFPAKPVPIKVNVSVSSNSLTLRTVIEGCFNRALRKLGDVKIADAKPDFNIHVLHLQRPNSSHDFAVAILAPLPSHYWNPNLPDSLRQSLRHSTGRLEELLYRDGF